ncbi:MAG: lysophospholipid acyltransferase family protein [Cytophagaceae bacterium]|nr:lysophospholipid acyltransferase family protein [Cytophagaceae bacterium]
MVVLFKIFSRIPWWCIYGFSDFLYLLLFHVVKYRKRVVLENLRKSFPEKSEKELLLIAKGFYKNLSDIGVEILKIPSLTKEEIQKRVVFKNLDLYLGIMQGGESVLVLTGHQCNWEWLLLGASTTHEFPIDAVYKPLHSPSMDAWFIQLRSKFGASPLAMKDVFRSVIRNKGQVRCMAMVADQTPPHGEIQLFLPFLNQNTAFFVGADKIVRHTQIPVLIAYMHRLGRGKYEVEFELLKRPPFEQENELITLYANALEKDLKKYPSDWLWSHKRWKFSEYKFDRFKNKNQN